MDKVLKIFLLLVGLFIFFSGSPSYADEDFLPVITITKTKVPPVIDGKMEPGEWQQAAGVSGFLDLSGNLVPHQTFVYITYDAKKLYTLLSGIHFPVGLSSSPRSKNVTARWPGTMPSKSGLTRGREFITSSWATPSALYRICGIHREP